MCVSWYVWDFEARKSKHMFSSNTIQYLIGLVAELPPILYHHQDGLDHHEHWDSGIEKRNSLKHIEKTMMQGWWELEGMQFNCKICSREDNVMEEVNNQAKS